jgi:hypothetical protein
MRAPALTRMCWRVLSVTCICGTTSHSGLALSSRARAPITSTIGDHILPNSPLWKLLATASRQNASPLLFARSNGSSAPAWI